MPKIIVKHTHIEITNYNMGDSTSLEKAFSIYDKVTHQSYFKAIRYDEQNKVLSVPRGIDIPLLERWFQEEAYIDYDSDIFDHTEPTMIKYLPRDDVQKTALKFIIGEGDYRYTKNRSQLNINLNTGAGKTYITVSYMAYACVRGMIITSSLGWLEQWKKDMIEYTDMTAKDIYFISGSSNILAIMNRDMSKYKAFLVSHNTLKSYGDTYGWDKVGELFKHLKIGLKVYDEAHLNFDNICDIDFSTNTKKTLYLTATPARSDDDENAIYQLSFKNVPAIDLFNQETDPRTKYIAIKFNSRPTPQEQSMCMNSYGFDRNKYVNYLSTRPNFYLVLHLILDMAKKVDGKVLIYIGINKTIDEIYNYILSYYPELTNSIGIFTSTVTENKKEQLDKKIILSTTKSCGAAIDIKGLKLTVVLAEPFKSEVLARQTLGRTRDRNTVYVEVVDEGFQPTRRYYTKKLPIFEKYATECKAIKFKDDELLNTVSNILAKKASMICPIKWYNEDGTPKMIHPIIYL